VASQRGLFGQVHHGHAARAQWADDEATALQRELEIGLGSLVADGVDGAGRFAAGKGRGGSFDDI